MSIKHQGNVIPTMNKAKTIAQLCERKEKQTNQHRTPEVVVHTLEKTKRITETELSFKRI